MNYLNYMELDSTIFERLKSIQWFSKCAQTRDENLGLDVVWVSDWPTASKCLADPEWENTTLEAQNALTGHLAKKYSRQFQEWNKLVREAKPKLEEIVFARARQFQQQNGLNQKFLHCVQWDVLGIVMEQTYRACRPPVFSANLLTVYEHGRFPCGWKGEWPNGRLMVI